jgi:hypothetical protein
MSFFQVQRDLVWSLPCRVNLAWTLRGAVSLINFCGMFEDDEAIGFQ